MPEDAKKDFNIYFHSFHGPLEMEQSLLTSMHVRKFRMPGYYYASPSHPRITHSALFLLYVPWLPYPDWHGSAFAMPWWSFFGQLLESARSIVGILKNVLCILYVWRTSKYYVQLPVIFATMITGWSHPS